MMRYVADTNVLLDNLESLQGHEIVILSHVLRELEKHKSNRINGDLSFKARKATRFITDHKDEFTFDLRDYVWATDDDHEASYVDNMIIQACIENNYGLITNDVLLTFKADGYGIPVLSISDSITSDSSQYTGVKEVEVFSEQELADIYEATTNKFDLLINQYLIIKYNEEYHCSRWNGEYLVDVQLPPNRVVTAQNAYQVCALDLLWDTDVPIKFIIGTYGSGKTYLSVKVALEYVNGTNSQKHYHNLMMVRMPYGAGESIGFLPGDKEEKIGDFFKPLIQHLNGGEFELSDMERRGVLKKEIPYYMKGLSINDTIMVVDEAEDLTVKVIKLIGTRLGERSAVIFSGDFNQAEDKFIHDNGLYVAIEKLKGHPLVGVVCLQEDIRSDASRVFAELV